MRKFLSFSVLLSCITFLQIQPVSALWEGFSMLRDCKNSPESPCIESISAETLNGETINASLTGRIATGDGGSSINIDDEYQLPGLNFESPAGNRMIARVFFDGTMFQTVFEASWLDMTPQLRTNFLIPSPHRNTNLNCGTPSNRVMCVRNINFNQDLKFRERIRVPINFVVAYVNGRTDFLDYNVETEPSGKYKIISLQIHITKKSQVAQSDLQPNPLSTSDWADSEIDQTIANFFTPQNGNSQKLGLCSGVPAVSVISNGVNPDVPAWDSQSQTISVQVAGPHYKVNGEINAGFFQAKISKEMAKCLWNLDLSNQTKAQISLTDQSDNGATTIETIVGQFDGRDFVLTDSNFHFSSPKISFKLINAVETTPTDRLKVSKTRIITFICKKDKTLLHLRSTRAVCPKGYSLKK